MNDQPFGLTNMWLQGDSVTRTVAIFLLLMSIVSWVIILTKVIGIYKTKKLVKEVECFWHAPSIDVAISQMTSEENPFCESFPSKHEI